MNKDDTPIVPIAQGALDGFEEIVAMWKPEFRTRIDVLASAMFTMGKLVGMFKDLPETVAELTKEQATSLRYLANHMDFIARVPRFEPVLPTEERLLNEASSLCGKLRNFQSELPEGDRKTSTAELAGHIDRWCRFVEGWESP